MKRRAFLTMLGLAPVVAHSLPRPADPSKLATGGIVKAKHIVGERGPEMVVPLHDPRKDPFIFKDGVCNLKNVNIGPITAGIIRSKPDKFGNSDFVMDLTAERILIAD